MKFIDNKLNYGGIICLLSWWNLYEHRTKFYTRLLEATNLKYRWTDRPNAFTNQANNHRLIYSTSMYYGDAAMTDTAEEGSSLDAKRKKSGVLSEPQKPVSAYALFFRDTQAAIKGQNPDASFEEVSKIVTSMWDALDPGHKNVYKKKAEAAKREYLKALSAYRATAVARGEDVSVSSPYENGSSSPEKTPVTSPKIAIGKARVTSNQESPCNEEHETENTAKDNTTHANSQTQPQNFQNVQTQQQQQSGTDQNVNPTTDSNEIQRCIREGCANLAIINADWEDEYCSNECVITHCRNVFAQWVQANSMAGDTYSAS